jgi:hypothetical protein
MPKDTEYADLGFYEPGVFHLEIATREDLNDFNRLVASPIHAWTVSTFLHEYIHFLQDTTSTHGLLNFIGYVEYLKNAIKQVMENAQAEFATPLNIANSFEYLTNNNLRAVYYGNRSDAENIAYSSYYAENINITTNGGQIICVPKYTIRYYDNGAQSTEECHFGSRHIKEYMAHAIQNQFAPNTRHCDIPYVLIELIIKKEYRPLAADTSLIVALCDAALMHYHPAQLFFSALERMKQTQWTPTDIDSVYAFVFDGLKLNWANQTETFDSLHRKTASSAIDEFRDALKADIFKENVQWFEQVIKGALNLRIRHRGFFAKLVLSPGKLSPLFYEFFDELGTPFMTNALSKGYFHPPKKLKSLHIQPYFPWVFRAISKTFNGRGENECLLHSFCETRTDKQVTDHHCVTSPWERVNLPELCPYAQMWKTWGLVGKKPVPSPRAA